MIDTHSHLDDETFAADREVVLSRAWEAGLQAVVTIGTSVDSSREAVRIAESDPRLFAVVGIHPTSADQLDDVAFHEIRQMADHPKVVGIGETGLDYYWKTCPPQVQQAAFRKHIDLARTVDKPVVIHNRDAHEDVLKILKDEKKKHPALRGIMHCFSGDEHQLRSSLELDFYISFAGNVTYKKSTLTSVATHVPADRILAETDSPYLTPVPHRGKRNEPAYVLLTIDLLAACFSVDAGEMRERVAANARIIYGIDV